MTSLNAMHEASRTLSEGALHLNMALANGPRIDPVQKAVKSSRFLQLAESDVRGLQLDVDDIKQAHQRNVAASLALAEKRREAEKATVLAAVAPLKPATGAESAALAKPSLVTALVEDVPAVENQPFDLVLAEQDAEDEGENLLLPSDVPLPEARPLMSLPAPLEKPEVEKPLTRKPAATSKDLAYAKPEPRTLFGDLFKRKSEETVWTGRRNKVAVYDVSNATVYLPDGTKLRAHSGIGTMRDNPRYEHVKMRGPTPRGIYRLSMREKRFYGVEAIRMTSIDGRDPNNRTGLLTHTNLLRGQIGSHGCVAFQNYQPFLKAFKRGEINTLVVVPEMPSSRTELAELYRKAGA